MFKGRKIRAAISVAAMVMTGALILSGCSGGSDSKTAAGEKVTLNFAFWGNDVRAKMYKQAIVAFNKKYPDIKVNVTFLGFPEFWEKRQIEATGGGLPDVMQFDYSYLRQYAQNGLLLDLGPYLGKEIDTAPLSKQILGIGVVDDKTFAIATSTNAWALYQNPKLLAKVGVDAYAGGGSWQEYRAHVAKVTAAAKKAGVPLWGGSDDTGRIQELELQLRAEGSYLFSDDGKPGFDKKRLKKFWEQGTALRKGAAIPQQRLEERYPLSGFDSALTTSELTWDNFGAGYLGNLGKAYTKLSLVAPPVTVEGAKDLYLKPSMLHTVSVSSKHPKESVLLLNFLINSPEVGAAFGTNRGLPASKTQIAGAALDTLGTQIKEYEASIAGRLGDPPPVPIVGSGTIEEKFRVLGTDLGLGVISVDQAVDQFFAEVDVVLNK